MKTSTVRVIAFGCIALTLGLQGLVAAFTRCEALELFIAGFIMLVPAILFAFTSKPSSGIGAAFGSIPFLMWANHAECLQAQQSGGAAMAYVFTLFIGVPASALIGCLTQFVPFVLRIKPRKNLISYASSEQLNKTTRKFGIKKRAKKH
ncbi:hypothetical protein HQ393_02170 [Chitinibacter bivalviorum]|uniref:Uncharacterized protein n=1 Tax=Chitinibacter bivalviorum TaxID=2739434 RepID=A0A7H9BF01_9NEIS|nr:hypothetical protein [Chitinibacter bivalviorum]QLG87147.1 hypothetical protein HQ393_02170 [Chitinibacter bivalviorum]